MIGSDDPAHIYVCQQHEERGIRLSKSADHLEVVEVLYVVRSSLTDPDTPVWYAFCKSRFESCCSKACH